MSSLLTRNLKFTIGGPEVTPGTAVAREFVLPIRGLPGLRTTPEMQDDPVITGTNMSRGSYVMAKNLAGGLPLSPRCVGGFGQVLNSLLGQESTPVQIGAAIRLRYTGSEASCKIVADTSGDTLDSDVGDLGSESGDSNFGTAGSIDLTAIATDTVGELVTEIDGYADYECEKIFGSDSVDAADIVSITSAQGKGRWVYIFFSSTTSGYYLHSWPVILSNTERPVYTVQGDGLPDNYLYDGVMFNELSLNAALKGMVEGTVQALGFDETGGQSESALTLETTPEPLIFSQGSLSVGQYDFPYTRNLELTLSNNADTEGYGMGSLARQYHRKANFTATGRVTMRHSTNGYSFYSGIYTNDIVGLSFYFKATNKFDASADIPQIMIMDIPFAQLSDLPPQENNGVIDIALPFMAKYPDGQYGSPFSAYLITDDSGAY